MKILFCSNLYEHVDNGPAKFANLVLHINTLFPQHQVKILTEDVAASQPDVFKLNFKISRPFRLLGQFKRMFSYYRKAMQIRKNSFHFDILVYNHALIGLISAICFRNTVGFINDYNNTEANFISVFKQKKIKHHIFHVAEFLTTLFIKKIIVNSLYMAQEVKQAYNMHQKKIYLLYKAVEITPVKEWKQNISYPAPVVLFVKSDFTRGGLFLLIAALKLLQKPVQLIVIGPEISNQKLIQKEIKNSLIDLKFSGKQPQQLVYAAMMQSDIFCVPAYMEAFGVSNVEAMALGCAVVSTKAGGIPEALDNGNCGWLVDAGNANLLADAIRECITNDAQRNQKKEYALKFAQKFNLQTCLENFINILAA